MSSASAVNPGLVPPAAELLLHAIVESSDDAILSKNLDGIVTSWNSSAERIFGYTREEMVGQSITLLLPADRFAEEASILEHLRRGERVDHFESVRRRKDGRLIDVSVTISPIRNHAGAIIGAANVAREITAQKRDSLSGLLLSAIVSSSEDAIVSKDLSGIITSWNAAAQHIFGYTAEEMVGQSVLKLVPADRKDEEPRILERLRRGERVEHFETMRVRKNGELFPVSLSISPLRDSAGNIVGASKIARDITELKRISADLEQLLASERLARAQAEHANRMKDDFLATVSHELRTPLGAIVSWTQVLKESAGRPEDLAIGIETIERNAYAQAQLIDDLLDLGRIVSGKMALDVEPVDLSSVIAHAIATVKHAADTKEILIRTSLADPQGTTMADKKRLQQVLWNLLTNAIKFTPKQGRIMVSLRRNSSHIELAIADTGRGIDPEFLPHVFERFRQGDPSLTRQHGGLGIGLAIVKQLVEMHGGNVQAESAGLNQGATFIVSLPVVAIRSSRPPGTATTRQLAGADFEETDLTGIRVLVVDDDRDSLDVIKRILMNRHAQVQTAASVADALPAFTAFQPDILLSDIGMPERDGYEFIRLVRELPAGRFVPAAALTALARSEDRMRALKAGFQAHVTKPVAPAELVAVIRSLANLRASPRMEGQSQVLPA